MAKYVLLTFDSDDEADKFVKETQELHAVVVDTIHTISDAAVTLKCAVRGVYKKPTQFCRCVGIKKRAFTRGQKYGWWVCNQCKKPTVGWGRGDHWFMALGRNLLPVDNSAPEYRGDGVFARSFKACSTCGNTLVTELGHAQALVYCPQCQEWR